MKDSDSGFATITLDQGSPVPATSAIAMSVPHLFSDFRAWAYASLGRYRVGTPAYAAEDAVQGTFVRLWECIAEGKIRAIETEEQLIKAFRHELKQEVLHERDREHALKRTCPDGSHDVQASALIQGGASLEAIDSHSPPADEEVMGLEEVEVSLDRLDRYDPALRLRTIAVMKMDGSKHREIAAALGLPLSVIEHRVRLMRAILAGRGSEPH